MKFDIVFKVFAILLIGVLNFKCKNDANNPSLQIEESGLSGEELAKIHCSSCHLLPNPNEANKKSWEESIFLQMGYRFGIYPKNERASLIESGIGGNLVERANIYPKKQIIATRDFEKIKNYYVENSPEKLTISEFKKLPATDHFSVVEIADRFKPPMGTMLKSFPEKDRIIYSDAKEDYSSIQIMNTKFDLIQSLAVPKPISDIQYLGDTLIATSMGKFTPNDSPLGRVFKMFKTPGKTEYSGFFNEVTDLQRPISSVFSDLNNDGLTDIVVCEYGHHTGGLNWYEKTGTRKYNRHVIFAQPGASKAIVHDFNNDNLPDIMALMAQSDEGIDIHYNLGNGSFERKRVLSFSPLSGSVMIHLNDVNNDGHPDIVYINGDNADYSIVDKPYHGVYFYINDGNNEFTEEYFFHLPGAYDAQLHDFDNDGDLDIAAISFFPAENKAINGMVYLENNPTSTNKFNYKAYSIPETEQGRWIKIDVNDINNDGLMDITLLSFTSLQLANDNDNQYKKWLQTSPSILHLRNNHTK